MVVKRVSGKVDDLVRGIVQSHLHEKGWDVLYRLNVELSSTPHLVEAGINRDDWMISMQVDPSGKQSLERLVAREALIVENVWNTLLCAAADREEGHWSICPFDRDYVEDILYGISTGLKAGGLKEDEVVAYTPDVANLFMDFIDNTVNAVQSRTGFGEGIGLFYLNQLRQPQCSRGYVLFVDSQMKVYGKSGEAPVKKKELLARIIDKIFGSAQKASSFRGMAETHPAYKKVKKDVERLAASTLPKVLAEKAFKQGLDGYDSRLVVDELQKRELWEGKAKMFAEVFAPYAKQASPESQGSGDGKEGKQQSKGNGSGNDQKRHEHGGRCGFVRRMLEDPDVRKDIIQRALRKGRQAGPVGVPYVTKQESFETAYDLAAEEIVLKYFKDDEDDELPTFDLFYLRDRKLEDDESVSGRFAWSKTFFVPTPTGKKVWLHKKEVPYQIEEELLPGRKGLEDILFLVDVSGSMNWSGRALDGSKYDLAVRAVFGAIKGLERMGRAAHANYGLVLFSDKTVFSGWGDYYSLDKFKRLVFTGYQGGGTELNAGVMEKVLQENKNRFLTLLISDGEIYNNDASDIVKKIIEAGNDVVQFSIQGSTGFSQKIKKHGADIVNVNKPEDLAGVVLEKVKERYQ
ncbi:MAG: VWA domain-containing protein [Candidatus Aenigmarchaeota archaeon]|nr:VWA domain-containing protein [Candidatus Aenigmarchaeota archaeon]